MSDLTIGGFDILILAPLKVGYGGRCICKREGSVVFSRHERATPQSLDDSRPLIDESENGTKAAGSVMKAAG